MEQTISEILYLFLNTTPKTKDEIMNHLIETKCNTDKILKTDSSALFYTYISNLRTHLKTQSKQLIKYKNDQNVNVYSLIDIDNNNNNNNNNVIDPDETEDEHSSNTNKKIKKKRRKLSKESNNNNNNDFNLYSVIKHSDINDIKKYNKCINDKYKFICKTCFLNYKQLLICCDSTLAISLTLNEHYELYKK